MDSYPNYSRSFYNQNYYTPKKIICPECYDIPLLSFTLEKGKTLIKVECQSCKFSKTFNVKDYIDEVNKLTTDTPQCPRHGLNKTKFCAICKLFLCDCCIYQHNANQPNHLLKDVSRNQGIVTSCIEHINNRYSFFCQDCKKNLCDECIKTHDKKHKCVNLKELSFLINVENIKNQLNKEKKYIVEDITLVGKRHLESLYTKIREIEESMNAFTTKNLEFYDLLDIIVDNYCEQYKNYNQIKNILAMNKIEIEKYKDNKKYDNSAVYIEYLKKDVIHDSKLDEGVQNTKKIPKYLLSSLFKEFPNQSEKLEIKELENGNYLGEIKNGVKHGRGILYGNNGEIYKGYFKNGFEDGQGIKKYQDGSVYEGGFKKGKKDGKGKFTFVTGDCYDGDYQNGQRTGKGTYRWSDGRNYVGEYKNGKRNGKGTIYFANGNSYEGDFKDDFFDGKGTYSWRNGDRFIGTWINDRRNGEGQLIRNGILTKGKWKDDYQIE